MGAHVLVADGDATVLAGLVLVVRAAGHRTSETATAAQALRVARAERPDLCLLDLALASEDQLAVLEGLAELDGAPSVVVMSTLGQMPAAIGALRRGACDLLEKPVRRELLEGVLARALATRAALRERDLLRREVSELRAGPIVARSSAMRRLVESLERVASTPRTTVLIRGESGVGKELVARTLHARSTRAGAPFVALSCAGLDAAALERELFGCKPGAGLAGKASSEGRIRAAEGGSLYLDEVGALAPSSQAKLLRALQEGVYRRVGGNTDRTMDVRVIASTRRDLDQLVEEGRFREDLDYRLNVMSLRVPPLRERREDLEELAAHFLARVFRELGREPHGGPGRELGDLEASALAALRAHDWPGNVRELRITLERAALRSRGGRISIGELGLAALASGASATIAPALPAPIEAQDLSLRTMEIDLIRRVLRANDGNRKKSAQILGINRTTLYSKLKSYGIDAERPA